MFGTLFQNDMKYLKKDPTMWVLACIPIILMLFYKYGVLAIAILEPFRLPIQYLFILMSSCMGGVLWGLRMLEDKDEHMTMYYAISPIGMKGYLHYKIDLCCMYSLLTTILMVMTVGRDLNGKLWLVISGTYLGPLVNLLLFSLASNKLQGMVYAKAIGILIILPLTGLIRENIFTPLIMLLPHYGLYEWVCVGVEDRLKQVLYIGEILVIIGALHRIQVRRID